MPRFLWGCCLWVVCWSATAQVYMWKDDSGKVHYSDQRRVDNAEATQIDIGTMPPPRVISAQVPMPFDRNVAPLLLDNFYYSTDVSAAEKELITYYFGGDCVSPTSQDFNQLRTTYPKVLRDENNLTADVFRTLRVNAYGSLYRAGHYSTPDLTDVGAVLLSGEIIDLNINACRSQLHASAHTGDLENSNAHEFDLLNAWLKVRWTLSTPGESDPLITVATEGIAATRLHQRLDLTGAVRVAFEMATQHLLALDDFRAQVEISEVTKTRPVGSNQAPEKIPTPAPTNNENVLAAERDLYQLALLRSNFARVLAELSTLKVAVTEYYHLRGVMPLTMGVLGYGAPINSRYIDTARLRAPGTIYVELVEEHLPGSHFVELTPVTEGSFTLIEWQCTSSLPESITRTLCQQP
ncbi:DUF4124 domain-containing protein [Gilvimarinus agarilyticus]|uniref:DUF4124 domain-containing protein n=1 Tax=Gilvimarinus sp. 2_MG-2023 TaxID=3062666 RepID=UPI001C09D0BD|nr:DUF4124 domain-containing protein [Gilvimarinus sp. 2_MG-2023]MBU2886638.1 DUF4124 domain-containing protein [Gilvimarinus agarilyticus]MDO6571306.1 DUF4124 domain-containing protein [Gilvimarinus sp. 2_MG-2023]